MSSTLRWRPVNPPDEETFYHLKFVLRDYWHEVAIEHGSVLDTQHIGVLKGIHAGASRNEELRRECERMIELIREHGEIEVWEEH